MSDAPNSHRKTTLGAVCEIVGNLVDPRLPTHSSLSHVGGANIVSHTGELIDLKTAQEEELISGKYLFTQDDVLYSKIRPYLRKVALPDFTGLCSADIYPLRPKQGDIRREYLGYLLLSDQFTEYANRVSNRAGMPKINREQFFAYEMELPGLDEQDRLLARIRGMMERVDEITSLQAEAAREAEALFASLVEAQLDSQWPLASLGDVTEDIRNGWSGKTEADGREVGVLRLSCVHGLTIDLDDTKPATVSESAIQDFQIRERDVFIVRGNGSKHLVGRSAIARETRDNVVFNDLLIRLQFKDTMLPEFCNLILHSAMARRQIEDSAKTAAGIWKINQMGIRSIQVPCPGREQQQVFVERVVVMRGVRDEIVGGIRSTPIVGIRQAILRKAFAGEL